MAALFIHCTPIKHPPPSFLPIYTPWSSCHLPREALRGRPAAGRMIRLRSKKLFKRSCSSRLVSPGGGGGGGGGGGEIQWELRPGGMLVQKRECGEGGDEVMTVRVSTGLNWHDISIGATATFGELKVAVAMVTGLEPKEQRLLFKGKEREDGDHLHMVGVRDKDKVLLLEDPATRETKLRAIRASQVLSTVIQV